MARALYAGSGRFTTKTGDRVTRHSFSFGEHYDPANLGFGPMVCHNDDLLAAGGGYPDHPHTDLEIVTWVLSGALVHTDSSGTTRVVAPGQVQVLSAGSGVRHSELADMAAGPTRFVQVWVRPDEPGGAPAYYLDDTELPAGALVPVAGAGGLPIRTAAATLHVARLAPGDEVALPDAPLVHVFAATGAVELPGGSSGVGWSSEVETLRAGDAARLTDEPELPIRATEPTELLVWSFR
ncbi:quercetin 2,3-dioxygenase [Nocardioides gansuensis]|uniref:Quercetin 2,3-dioxygenase n=1 Tax=Nocardioides gansuensis TaxID=2138300 RepID=A0A2T8FEV4_9ACTN|nr:pirin family protein [Nocardioides gansuensis]PVG84227.1 quercetin 2,3-dioxygenase [Nocardioides gansuensis]